MVSRRQVVCALGATALTPRITFAQSQSVQRPAILQLGSAESVRRSEAAFEQGLKELGYLIS